MSRIRLTPLDTSHLPALAPLIADPETVRFTRVPADPPAGFIEYWYGLYENGRLDGTRDGFAIVDEGGGFLGLALAPSIEAAARTVELGYMVAPHARGRGVATEALRLLTEWAENELGVLRIELLISVGNTPSKRVAERSGYSLEGVLRSVHLKEDVREDMEVWSRIAADRA